MDLQTIKKNRKIEQEAEDEIKEMESFSFADFERRYVLSNKLFRQRKRKARPTIVCSDDLEYITFYKKFPILLEEKSESGTIAWTYKEYIKKLLKEGRISTAVNYHCSYVSLKKFQGNVSFAVITTSYLIAYEQKMKERGLSKSTIGIYLRPLRAALSMMK